MSKQSANNDLLTSVKDGVRLVKFNRPTKKNAISLEIYEELTNMLNEDANNDAIVVTILTGVGEYYSSGNDLSAAASVSEDFEVVIEKRIKLVQDFVAAFINYPKLLIAVVNGPAIGIAVTTLPLCDVVYASNRASFSTPFVDLGFCPEGCSSYLFPRIMGRSKATEALILGQKLTAEEAYQFSLVSKIVPHEKLGSLLKELEKYGKLPVNTVKRGKQLIVGNLKSTLHEINKQELTVLKECFHSEEFFEGLTKFMSRKSKL